MDAMLYQNSAFEDVKLLLGGKGGFAGLLTDSGIEASTSDKPFISDKKVLSTYDEACTGVRRILTAQMNIELPKGFAVEIEPNDLAVFYSQKCSMRQMDDYLENKKSRTREEIERWLTDRPWDTNPMTSAQAKASNFVFDSETGFITTDGCFNPGRVVEIPSSVDKVRVTGLKSYCFVSYTYLETLVMPESITRLEPYTFYDKVHLKNVNISNNIEIIPEGAFAKCRNLNAIVIPKSVKKICDEAFYQCGNLFSVTIPDSVAAVGRCAFISVPHIYYHGAAKGYPWGATVGN